MNKWMKRFILSLFLMAMCICPVSAYVEIVEQDDSYFVTDDAKVLDSATEDYLFSKNQVLRSLIHCAAPYAAVCSGISQQAFAPTRLSTAAFIAFRYSCGAAFSRIDPASTI